MTTDTTLEIAEVAPDAVKARPRRAAKRSPANDPVQGVVRAVDIIDKLQEQNRKAENALGDLGAVWLNASANRRRADAAIALKHFDAALDMLRKALEAQSCINPSPEPSVTV